MAEPGGGVSVDPVVRLFQALSPADMDRWKVRASVNHVDTIICVLPATRVSHELVRIECICTPQQAFEQAMQGEVASPATGGDPSISGPIHLQPVRARSHGSDARCALHIKSHARLFLNSVAAALQVILWAEARN